VRVDVVLDSCTEVAMSIERLRASKYWSKSDGLRAVELWRASGESLSAFTKATGLRRTRLAYWLSRSSLSASPAFALASVTVTALSRASGITIELRGGRAIRVDGDFDDALLERVIVVAERAGC
jgi:hypothetical protein